MSLEKEQLNFNKTIFPQSNTYDSSFNRTADDISSFFDCDRSLKIITLQKKSKNSIITHRLVTSSHDSNILKAGGCPCSSIKILIKFDISSESFVIL